MITLDGHFFHDLTHHIQNSIFSLSHTFMSSGKTLAHLFLAIELTYILVEHFLYQSTENLISGIIQAIVRYGFVLFLLQHWKNLGHLFFEGMEEFAHMIRQQSDSTHVLSSIHHSIEAILHQDLTGVHQKLSGFPLFSRTVEAKIVSGATVLLLIIMGMAYLFIMNMGLILLGIGLVIGPLMVSSSILRFIDFLFDAWLRFMLTSSFYQVISAIVLVIIHTIMKHLSFLSEEMIYNAKIGIDYDFSILTMTMILCVLGISIVLQTPSICAALTAGARSLYPQRFPSQSISNAIRYVSQQVNRMQMEHKIAKMMHHDDELKFPIDRK